MSTTLPAAMGVALFKSFAPGRTLSRVRVFSSSTTYSVPVLSSLTVTLCAAGSNWVTAPITCSVGLGVAGACWAEHGDTASTTREIKIEKNLTIGSKGAGSGGSVRHSRLLLRRGRKRRQPSYLGGKREAGDRDWTHGTPCFYRAPRVG